MINIETLTRRFEAVFERSQADVLALAITDAYTDLVKTGDFNELKGIVRDLAVAQQHTDERLVHFARRTDEHFAELAVAQQRTDERLAQFAERTDQRFAELAAAQQRTDERLARTDERLAQFAERTDQRFAELAAAQQRTDERLAQFAQRTDERFAELAGALAQLTRTVNGMGQELGGLSRSMSYALENEAYRSLPAPLAGRYGITVHNQLVRQEIDGEEINLFAHGERNGQPVLLVGETKLQLDERRSNRRATEETLDQLDVKADAVRRVYPDAEIVRLLITHYARPGFLAKAEDRGVVVIQSFEW
jgi:hypothetical protein